VEYKAIWEDKGFMVAFGYDPSGYREMRINGGLQWNERDEYRYHQVLFGLPVLCQEEDKELDVLILGGGDGLGVRELLVFPEVRSVKVVDISKMITTYCSENRFVAELNLGSLNSERVEVINEDGLEYVKSAKERGEEYDVIILDYPDPSIREDDPINKLFTAEHYKDVRALLKKGGIVSLQATSVFITPNVFRRIQLLLAEVGFTFVAPLRVNIKSYGDVGLILCSDREIEVKKEIPEFYFFTRESLSQFFLNFFHRDERPDLDDEKIKRMSLHELIYYDFKIRPQEVAEWARRKYLEKIREGEKKWKRERR
jgi:spermidine synthase